MKIFSRPLLTLGLSATILAGVVGVRLMATPVQVEPRAVAVPAARVEVNNSDAQLLQSQLGTVDTQGTINVLQSRIKQSPEAGKLYAQLGWAYVQRLRETADASLYVQATQSFDEALKRDGKDVDALLGQGSLALSRHEFAQAIEWGEKAKAINPFRAQIYGVIGDAEVELGRYPEAIQSIQKMVDTRPDLSSYSRVSYVRELHGDVAGAIEAMRKAIEAGNPQSEGTLWSQYQLGNLFFNKGDLAQAEATYRAALQIKPDYIYARAGLAKIDAARGLIDGKPELLKSAISQYERINEMLPLPEFVIALGDLYEANHEPQKAKAQFDLVRAIQKLNADAAMNVDMEMALFEADRLRQETENRRPTTDDRKSPISNLNSSIVDRARKAYEHRPSIYAADVLAWALYQNGEFAEAQKYSQEALRLNTRDALLHFHAGLIAQANGDGTAAKQHLQTALTINPYFSIRYALEAQRRLSGVE